MTTSNPVMVAGGWIGAVGRIRDEDFGALQVPAGAVVGLDEQKAGEFSVRACGGLEGHRFHAGDGAEDALRLGQYLHAACAVYSGCSRSGFP